MLSHAGLLSGLRAGPSGRMLSWARTASRARMAVVGLALAAVFIGAGAGAAHAAAMLEPQGPVYDPDSPAAPRDLGWPRLSVDIHGRLGVPGEIDVYLIEPPQDADIMVSLAAPSWLSMAAYRPAAIVVPASEVDELPASSLPTLIARSVEVIDPGLAKRDTFFDPLSVTRYYKGGASVVGLKKGVAYAIVVFDTAEKPGAYRLTIGTPEPVSSLAGLSDPVMLLRLKLGLYGHGGPDFGAMLFCIGDVLLLVALCWAGMTIFRRRGRAGSATPAG